MTKEQKKQVMDAVLRNTIVDLQSRKSQRDIALQQLREEFEAAQTVYASGFNGNGEEYNDPAYIAGWPHEWWPDFNEKRDMVVAARLYIIARDFGEFDEKRALMLWKLQNGGAV